MTALFRVPTQVVLAAGCRHEVGPALKEKGLRRILLVEDPGLGNTPWPSDVHRSLVAAGISFSRYDTVPANPRTTTAESAAESAHDADAIVALGGGSAIDTAKAAALLATNPGPILPYIGRREFAAPPLPTIAMPTTAGTGSEVTWVSVLTDEASATKVSVKGDALFPRLALVDPDVLTTLPPALAATTGMDALTHALEALTGRAGGVLSDACAREAARALFEWLPRLVASEGSDAQARREVMGASTLAGIAFGNADVAGVHCLSESLGGMFDVPHGLANAILLHPVLASHRPGIDADLASLGGGSADAWMDRILQLVAELDIPAFPALGVPPAAYAEVCRRAVANGSNPSNPRPMAEADYLQILVGER